MYQPNNRVPLIHEHIQPSKTPSATHDVAAESAVVGQSVHSRQQPISALKSFGSFYKHIQGFL